SRDLDELKELIQSKQNDVVLQTASQSSFGYLATEISPEKYTAWDMGEIIEDVTKNRAGMKIKLYQGLLELNNEIRVAIFENKQSAEFVHQHAVARLYFFKLADKI